MQRKEKNNDFFNKSNILIKNCHPSRRTPLSTKEMHSIIRRVISGEKAIFKSLIINLTNNIEIRKINKRYLNHDFYTDIITFPYENSLNIDGEIFISLDSVKKNAKIYGTRYNNEFSRVLIHGCLHLAGYNDKTKRQQELIRRKENFYLRN